jgi:hypothetical protein
MGLKPLYLKPNYFIPKAKENREGRAKTCLVYGLIKGIVEEDFPLLLLARSDHDDQEHWYEFLWLNILASPIVS